MTMYTWIFMKDIFTMLKGTPSWIYHKIFCQQLSKINYESLEKLLGAVHRIQHLPIFFIVYP
jgi:hypothetical protein